MDGSVEPTEFHRTLRLCVFARRAMGQDDPPSLCCGQQIQTTLSVQVAHSLKGNALTLGAPGLGAAAQALEQACAENNDDIEARLAVLLEAGVRVSDALTPLLSDAAADCAAVGCRMQASMARRGLRPQPPRMSRGDRAMQDLNRLYDQDYAAWAERTAELLRAGRFGELDVEHLIEELSDLGRSQQHELVIRLRVLLAYLLKWHVHYRRLPERWVRNFEGRSWRNAIIEQRRAIEYLLSEHPGLKAKLADAVAEAYPLAMDLAAAEPGLPPSRFPADCPYVPDEFLDRAFYPEPV